MGLCALSWFALHGAHHAAAQPNPEFPADVALQNLQWPAYGGDAGGTRYSDQRQIDRSNVVHLEVAWQYRTGELGQGFKSADKLAFEATPVLANGSLFLSAPTGIVIALDPSTGKQRWRYDPRVSRDDRYSEVTSRGVSSWIDPVAPPATHCSHRIFIGTLDARLIALDGISGQPCANFGSQGTVNLLTSNVRATAKGEYLVTSPPAIYQDLVIVGAAIGDNRGVELERGIVRAFDTRTGAQRWSWDPIPDTAEAAAKSDWTPEQARRTGAANAWSVFAVDTVRGIVYVPTGAPSPDFYGGERAGSNAHANSIVALRAQNGAVLWSKQLVHHDLWDYDLAAQPVLVNMEREGKSVEAVVQATKMGTLFVLDRETGEPINDIIERAVPQSSVAGERSAPTQPFTTTPTLTSHAAVTPDQAWGLTFYDRRKCRDLIGSLKSDGIFTPPSFEGSIQSPSYVGGVNWGSAAYDSSRQLLVTAVNHIPMVVRLVPRDKVDAANSSSIPFSRSEQQGTPYMMERGPLLSPFGLPCTAPPWGTLAAVDLQRNLVLWQVPLGSTADFTPWFVPSRTIGMPNMGGPIVTAGDLVFVAAATDNYLRAFDIATGRELWKGRLPAGGQATPMTYAIGGKQFVVIAAGGHGGLGTTPGDYVIAFALPASAQN
jgi:quinoprotein glucose dehydrogenase